MATNGSDTGLGTLASPFATFTHTLPLLQPGDVLFLRGGLYSQVMKVGAQGTATDQITIAAYQNEVPAISQPSGWQNLNPHGATVTLYGNYVTLYGLSILGSKNDPAVTLIGSDQSGQNGITFQSSGIGNKIINCEISYARHCGIKEMDNGDFPFVLEGNLSHDNGYSTVDHGIYVPSNRAIIRGNATFNNAGAGIHAYATPNNCQIYDNVSFNNIGWAILEAGDHNAISNNVMVGSTTRPGFTLYTATANANSISGNVIQGNHYANEFMDETSSGLPNCPINNTFTNNVMEGWSLNTFPTGNQNTYTGNISTPITFLDAAHGDYRGAPGTPLGVGLYPATGYSQ